MVVRVKPIMETTAMVDLPVPGMTLLGGDLGDVTLAQDLGAGAGIVETKRIGDDRLPLRRRVVGGVMARCVPGDRPPRRVAGRAAMRPLSADAIVEFGGKIVMRTGILLSTMTIMSLIMQSCSKKFPSRWIERCIVTSTNMIWM